MMKKISVVWISLVILLDLNVQAMAQSLVSVQQNTIQALPLLVTYSKTTNLLFPYAIKSVDKGSKDVLVQVAKGVENLLQVKAAKQGFSETNLTVVTADGKLYSYVLNYSDQPPVLNIKVGSNKNYPGADALFTYRSDNEARVYDITEQLSSKMPLIKNIKAHDYDLDFTVDGIYIKDDKLYFQFGVTNNSNIDYNVDALRLFIVDKKKSKRTASQEIELQPIEQVGNTEIIRGKSHQNFVITLSKFTIPDKKFLSIRLMEQGGGRHLQLKVENKHILASSKIE
ncbi:conjugative transposon protein TraN [Pedobacter sp. GR22-10]|uniref:conjugative transposon protein TraN n=1 Tax=Pedobacter sp. GR22-10 TaxID=2994472 RepID=UPI0022464461|nr:conjugative transposon protein TraN [Pedobacter sp. GR22-10]MCX2429925.1 conjugative transposon protein TraN [Pedobacter sp. GR22-10]